MCHAPLSRSALSSIPGTLNLCHVVSIYPVPWKLSTFAMDPVGTLYGPPSSLQIPLVVVAPDVTKDALALLIVNKLKGVLPSVAIRAPGFGDRMAPLLQDLAIVCDGEYIAQVSASRRSPIKIQRRGTMLGAPQSQVFQRSVKDAFFRCGLEAHVHRQFADGFFVRHN